MHLCRWLKECKRFSDFEPDALITGKELEDYWVNLYETSFENGSFLPKWTLRHYRKYHGKISSDDEDLGENDT